MNDLSYLQWTLFLAGYAVCSGANVAYFSFSRRDLRKTMQRGKEASPDSQEFRDARRAEALLKHIEQPNWTLAAILLTNVGFGVQLSQLSESIFPGVLGLIMPIVSITIVGEFLAQATFLRYAGPICAFFSPLIWLLKYVTSPVSWPLAWAVDKLYGREGLRRLSEQELLSDLELELTEFGKDQSQTHVDYLDPRELKTLMNAAQADDEPASTVGEVLDPATIIELSYDTGRPVFPDDLKGFIHDKLGSSQQPWFVIVNADTGQPDRMLDADGFVRDFYQCEGANQPDHFDPRLHVYRTQIYRDAETKLGQVISDFMVYPEHSEDDVVDVDVALIWTDDQRWIVTGGDILGRLLKGVARQHRTSRLLGRRRSHRKTSMSD